MSLKLGEGRRRSCVGFSGVDTDFTLEKKTWVTRDVWGVFDVGGRRRVTGSSWRYTSLERRRRKVGYHVKKVASGGEIGAVCVCGLYIGPID